MIYETAHLTFKQAKEFCRRFDLEIGTERELNNIDLDTLLCLLRRFGINRRNQRMPKI
jgi:hypothetical protein